MGDNTGIRQRWMQASYLNIGGDTENYNLLGTGFTDLNESPSAKTKERQYVNDKASTTSVTGYDWKTSFSADQIRSDAVIEYICNLAELEKTGIDVEAEYVAVDLDKREGATGTKYRARKKKVAIAVSDFGSDDGEMTCEGEFVGQGDVVEGLFDTSTKTFEATVVIE